MTAIDPAPRDAGASAVPAVPAVPAVLAQRPPATAERAAIDRLLLERYHREGDTHAREELVTRLMPLARRVARRYQRAGEPLDDLLQVALLGLANAIERFDLERETSFAAFAVPTMLGELKRHFRDHGWAVHVPRGLQERVQLVSRTVDGLSRRLGRAPSVGEVADALELTEEDVLEAMAASTAHDATSLDGARPADDGETSYAELIGAEDHGYELAECRATLERTLAALPDRDRQILRLRFADDLTQSEIAERMGISQMHVSRILRRSLARASAITHSHDATPAAA